MFTNTIKGQRETVFISEPAVYRVIFRSDKPEAIRFADWVCEDVLPAIRKTGAYGTVTTKEQISGTQLILSLLRELKKTKDLFARELILKRLSHVCNTLGETLPDTSHIGKDYRQHALPLQDAG